MIADSQYQLDCSVSADCYSPQSCRCGFGAAILGTTGIWVKPEFRVAGITNGNRWRLCENAWIGELQKLKFTMRLSEVMHEEIH